MKYLAFDLEIAKEIPEGCTDWRSVGPLGITCAAALRSDGDLTVWKPLIGEDGCYRDRMTPDQVDEMARYLLDQAHAGYLLITWNGLGFDFPVMVEEMHDERLKAEIAETALFRHIDMAYQMRCEKGYMIGLNTCAQALGVEGKTEGMHGDLAPVMWKKRRAEQDRVLEYVAQDVRVTAAVYEALLEKKSFKWVTKRGKLSRYPWAPKTKDGMRMLTCAESARLPEVDTSWMDRKPSTVESYYAWTGIDMPMSKVDPTPTMEQRVANAFGSAGYRFVDTPESEGAGAKREPEYPPMVADEPPPGFVEDTDIPF